MTAHLRSGETLTGSLVREDEFSVEFTDGAGWHRSVARDSAQITVDDPMTFHREQLARYSDANMHDLLAYLETLK